MSVEDPEAFSAVIQRHDQLIKLAALESDEVFRIAGEALLFNTNGGRTTLGEHIAQTVQETGAATIRYQTVALQSHWPGGHGHQMQVIDASHGLDEAILRKYDRQNPAVALLNVGRFDRPAVEEVNDTRYAPLLELYAKMDPPLRARTARFSPASLALVAAPPQQDEMTAELERLFLLSQVSGAMRAQDRAGLQRALTNRPASRGTGEVYINVTSPVTDSMLAALERGDVDTVRRVAELNVIQAAFHFGGNVDPERLRRLSDDMKIQVLQHSGAHAAPEAAGPSGRDLPPT